MKEGRDILSEYGNDVPSHQQPRASNGGVMPVKPIPYDPPVGPKGIYDKAGPGLHGNVHPCGTQRDS